MDHNKLNLNKLSTSITFVNSDDNDAWITFIKQWDKVYFSMFMVPQYTGPWRIINKIDHATACSCCVPHHNNITTYKVHVRFGVFYICRDCICTMGVDDKCLEQLPITNCRYANKRVRMIMCFTMREFIYNVLNRDHTKQICRYEGLGNYTTKVGCPTCKRLSVVVTNNASSCESCVGMKRRFYMCAQLQLLIEVCYLIGLHLLTQYGYDCAEVI